MFSLGRCCFFGYLFQKMKNSSIIFRKVLFEKCVSEDANNIFHDIVKDILQRSYPFSQKKNHFFS